MARCVSKAAALIALGAMAVVLATNASCNLLVDTSGLAGDAADASDVTAYDGTRDGSEAGAADAPTGAETAVVEAAPDADGPDPYFIAVMSDNPIAYFRFSDPPGPLGSNAKNEVAQSAISAQFPSTGITFRVPGALSDPRESAIRMTDSNAAVTLLGPTDFPGDVDFSIEAWASLDTPSDDGFLAQDMDGANGPGSGFFFFVTNMVNSEPEFRSEMWNGGVHYLYTQHHSPVLAQHFYHLVLLHTKSDHMDHLYVNGVGSEDGIVSGDGKRGTNAVPTTWGGFVGVLDELAYYNTALSLTRIGAHYAAHCAPACPL
jgi:hypothetical protein